MEPAAPNRPSEPHLTVFHCEHCCPGIALAAGAGNHIRLIPGSTGKVDAARLREAFLEDTDGVLIIGCLKPSCCIPGNDVEAFLLIHDGAMALHRLGVDPARLRRVWLLPSEAHLVNGLITAFRRRVNALGPRFEARTPRPDLIPDPVPVPVSASAQG